MKRLSFLFAILLAGSLRAADVSGFVFRDDGVVEGVRVQALVPVTGTSLGETITGTDGGFAFTGLPDGVIEVRVDDSSWLVLAGDVMTVNLLTNQPKERERPAPSPRVRGEGTITGVVSLNGKALANAPVMVQGLADRSIEPLRVVTNAKGEFRAAGLEPLRYAVVIDDRLVPRVRMPHSGKMYAEGQEPYIVDLRKSKDAAANVELTPAPMIRGRVVDAEGKPVGRARVLLTIANRPALDFMHHRPADRTTPDGRFALPAPEWSPAETVNVAVAAPLRSTFRSKSFPLGTADRTVDIALPRLEAVQVRVTDRAGKPVPEARVAFVPAGDGVPAEMLEMAAQGGARANAAGEVALQLAPDAYDFAVSAKDFQLGSVTKRIARPATVDVTLERAATLRGRVHRGERGVADVHVTILSGNRARRDANATTDADGNFELGGLAPGPYRLGVFQANEMIERTLEVEAPGNVDVALPPAGTLRGRVLDAATGTPVRAFAFSVEPVADQPRGRRGGPSGVQRGEQSEDGTFRVTVPVGTYRVTVGAMGYTASEPLEVNVTEEGPAPLDIPLGRGISVTGRVTDEAGLPVAEADVMIVGEELERMRRRATPRVGPGHAKSAEDGTFTITGVEAGQPQMTVRKPGYVPFRRSLQADGPLTVDVKLVRGLSLPGIVTRNGKPAAGAQISASTSAIGGEHQNAVSGEDGRFVLTGLVPARYSVSAYLDDQNAELREVDPAKQKELAISLDPKPRGVVFGTVTGIPPNMGGKYVQRNVIVQGPDGGAEGTIDEAGNYRIENAPVGAVTVAAHVESSARNARSSVRRQVELVAGQPQRVDLELAGNVRVTGRVTHEGKPLAGAHVGFSSEDGTTASAMTREDGGYEVALPLAGRYHIFARAEQLSDRHFQTVRDVRGGESIDIDLREQVVEGTVVDAVTRQPIANAIVTLAPAMSAVMSISGEVPVDANGRFRMTTTGTGTHRLIASAPGYAYRSMPVVSDTTHYAFELQPAAELRVRVLDSRSGTPLDAHLMLHEAGGAFVPGRLQRSGDGTYGFSLAPGRYKLTAVVHGYTTRVVEVTAPGTIDVRME